MSTIAITLPAEYPFVALAAVSTFWVNAFQSIIVGRKRKAAGIKYPQAYAEKAEAEKNPAAFVFNCAQRAHQNTLEILPHVLFSTLFIGLAHPKLAAGLGFTWSIGRVFYTLGYLAGPEKRGSRGGVLSTIAGLGLLLASSYTAFDFVRSVL